jgi:NitT/TauT family transport system permease protein
MSSVSTGEARVTAGAHPGVSLDDVAIVERVSRTRRVVARVVPPLIAFWVLIGVWYYLAARLSPNRKFLLPTPWAVVTKGLFNWQAFKEIMGSLWLTTQLALVGLLVAIALGLAIAVLMYQFRTLERACYPYLVALQAVPILAISPLMTVAFGYGFWSKAIVCVIIAFFPIPTNTLLGMKSVDPGMRDLFTLQRAGWFTRLRKLALPNAMPAVFTGFRIAAGLSVIGAIVGELFFQQGKPGLGLRLAEYRVNLEYEKLYTTLLWSSLLGIAVFLFFGWLANRVLRSWHESARVES